MVGMDRRVGVSWTTTFTSDISKPIARNILPLCPSLNSWLRLLEENAAKP